LETTTLPSAYTHTSSSRNGSGSRLHGGMVVAAVPVVAEEAAEITYGYLWVTAAMRGCSCLRHSLNMK